MPEIISKTRERMYDENFKSREDYLIFLRHMFEYEFAKNNIKKNSFVLDIGCGGGYGTHLLSKHAKNIVGLDIDKDTISKISNRYSSENCFFKLFDGTTIPYNDETFEVIVSFHVIEHIYDDLNFISEIHRVLKKDGIFIISTPNKTLRVKNNGKLFNEFHIREYYPIEFRKLLENKFSNIEQSGVFGDSEVQRIEIERLKMIKFITSLDIFNIERFIPTSTENTIIKSINSIFHRNKNDHKANDYLDKYSTENYHLDENEANHSLDLLAICKK